MTPFPFFFVSFFFSFPSDRPKIKKRIRQQQKKGGGMAHPRKSRASKGMAFFPAPSLSLPFPSPLKPCVSEDGDGLTREISRPVCTIFVFDHINCVSFGF